jgi:hypothetical protein
MSVGVVAELALISEVPQRSTKPPLRPVQMILSARLDSTESDETPVVKATRADRMSIAATEAASVLGSPLILILLLSAGHEMCAAPWAFGIIRPDE